VTVTLFLRFFGISFTGSELKMQKTMCTDVGRLNSSSHRNVVNILFEKFLTNLSQKCSITKDHSPMDCIGPWFHRKRIWKTGWEKNYKRWLLSNYLLITKNFNPNTEEGWYLFVKEANGPKERKPTVLEAQGRHGYRMPLKFEEDKWASKKSSVMVVYAHLCSCRNCCICEAFR